MVGRKGQIVPNGYVAVHDFENTRNPFKTVIIILALIFTLLFTITSCGGSEEKQNPGIKPESGTNTSAPADAASEGERETTIESKTAQEVTQMKMKIQVKDTIFTATLAQNSSVDALKELMADGPLTLNMSDYAGMEKGADLGVTLPQNNEPMNTQAGDIILYQGRTFVIYYDTNSWSLTPIGKIDNVDAKSLKEVLGTGNVTVTLSLE